MTGVADLYLYLKHGRRKEPQLIQLCRNNTNTTTTKFVVLAWKRTGSNLLCGILYHHPEILMHNELFNGIDIFTYYTELIDKKQWTVLSRDLFPEEFLHDIWSLSTATSTRQKMDDVSDTTITTGDTPEAAQTTTATTTTTTATTTAAAAAASTITTISKPKKAIGFKSFPEHWSAVRNESCWMRSIMNNMYVKKIVLYREDELAVYVSTLRADITGIYLGMSYPKDLQVHVDPAAFQRFLINYRDTYTNKYKSPFRRRDTFRITYEQLTDDALLSSDILPKLYRFLNVDPNIPKRQFIETLKQSNADEDLSQIISNYHELEFCFRYSDVKHFMNRRSSADGHCTDTGKTSDTSTNETTRPTSVTSMDDTNVASWSILLPICSRGKTSQAKKRHDLVLTEVNTNRLLDLCKHSQHDPNNTIDDQTCWSMLEEVCCSLKNTSSSIQLDRTEIIVGIDVDDAIYYPDESKRRISSLFHPCHVKFVDILKPMYGKVCSIWSHLARHSKNDFIVLLGDDVHLLDQNWQTQIVNAFYTIAHETGLPLGAACVCLNDISFPGFPTFPVIHRWHVNVYNTLLPKQFVNQGGDPYLFELYSRYNASCFASHCRLENTIGGDGDARYKKYPINWRGQILTMNLGRLRNALEVSKSPGFVLDVVIPSYRINNTTILSRIAKLRASVKAYVKFWIVVDNPNPVHVQSVKEMAINLNKEQADSNYFINVINYSENRGARYARNTGYNYSTADWILFLDDDIIPDENILDAYIGAIQRFPDAKVFVGYTELPDAMNLWTEMLRTCNVGYFYSISKTMIHPSWGVTANLMVRGSRFNPTIQFKSLYPKTGGGEDIDFVYQYKSFYSENVRVTAAVPEAIVHHPWWNNGNTCYNQITGWAKGDSLCITEWPEKTFLTLPNWVEFTMFILLPLSLYTQSLMAGIISMLCIFFVEHVRKGTMFYSDALAYTGRDSSIWRSAMVAIGAGSIMSAQEVQRVVSAIRRLSFFSICRRVDWFDGQKPVIKLDVQLSSIWTFVIYIGITYFGFAS